MTVEIIKGTKRTTFAQRVICRSGLPYKRLILLPIPTTKDGVTVYGTDITLESLLADVDMGVAVCGYGLPSWFCERAGTLGARIYDAMYDEDFQTKNAELTAQGALGEIISEKKKAPADLRFGIIGYGRIGSVLLKYLVFLGAKPIVFTRRESVCRSLGAWGIDTSTSMTLDDFMAVDVLINTSPMSITDISGAMALHNAGVSVFDLASGENFGYCEQVKRLPGVPDRVFPESAGIAYGEAICRALGGKG